MSLFAKVFIIINLVLALVMGVLLAALLVQRYDYKAQHSRAELLKSRAEDNLKRFAASDAAEREQARLAASRYDGLLTELTTEVKELEVTVKALEAEKRSVDSDVDILETSKSDATSKISTLTTQKETLDKSIADLESERETALEARKTADTEREKLVENFHKLEDSRISHEQRLAKVRAKVEDHEALLEAILRRFPETFQPMVEIEGKVNLWDARSRIVVIDKGRDDQILLGGRILLQRGQKMFIGTARIEEVKKRTAHARILNLAAGRTPAAGDIFKTDYVKKKKK